MMTPSDRATQRERASYAAAWIAAREAGAVLAEADWLRVSDTALPAKIRALSPPADAAAALAEMIEAARREEREANLLTVRGAYDLEGACHETVGAIERALIRSGEIRARAAGGAA